MLEGAVGRDREELGRPSAVVLPQRLDELSRRPRVEEPLLPLRVSVEGRGETALGGPQLAQQELGSLLPGPQRRCRPPVGTHAQEQRVVVEHLLEVRDHPAAVHAVAREPARQLVVDAAANHSVEGVVDHP